MTTYGRHNDDLDYFGYIYLFHFFLFNLCILLLLFFIYYLCIFEGEIIILPKKDTKYYYVNKTCTMFKNRELTNFAQQNKKNKHSKSLSFFVFVKKTTHTKKKYNL